MTAVGLAVLEEIRSPGFRERAAATASLLWAGLEGLSRRLGCLGVRGAGHLLALKLPRPVGGAVAARALEAGLLLNSPRPELLRFMPALTVTPDEVEEMLGRLEPVLAGALLESSGSAAAHLART